MIGERNLGKSILENLRILSFVQTSLVSSLGHFLPFICPLTGVRTYLAWFEGKIGLGDSRLTDRQ